MRELPSQVKETLSIKGRGSAGLRRLSRRGSWVRIPPPAPNVRPQRSLCSTLCHGVLLKSRIFSCRDLFLSGLDSGLVLEDRGIIGVSVIFRSVHIPVATSVKYSVLVYHLPRIGIGAECSLVSPCSVQNRRLFSLDRWVFFGGRLSEEHVARRGFFLGFLLEHLLFQNYEFPLHRFLGHAP